MPLFLRLGALITAIGMTASGALASDVDQRALQRLLSPPLGLPKVPLDADQKPTVALVALGRKLFFDRRLSGNGTMSCAMCHIPEQGFTNNELATPIGVLGRSIRRNAPTTINVAYYTSFFHDGRETSLETQVIGPLTAANEMGNPSIGYVVARVRALKDYEDHFRRAFGAGPSIGRIGAALAIWQKTIVSANSRFDRWYFAGDKTAMSNSQIRGFGLFTGKAGCGACHKIGRDSALFTDNLFHATGIGVRQAARIKRPAASVRIEIAPGVFTDLAQSAIAAVSEPPQPDAGRYEVTQQASDYLRFRTPSLRNVALTAPYMHDGSLRTLDAVVAFYNAGGEPHVTTDPRIRPLGQTEIEQRDLVAFLKALTGDNVAELIDDARSAGIGN